MGHYTISSSNMVTEHVCSKLKTSWKSVVLQINKVWNNSWYFGGIFTKTLFHSRLVDMRFNYSQIGTIWLVGYLLSHIQAQKFYTDDVSPPRWVVNFCLVEAISLVAWPIRSITYLEIGHWHIISMEFLCLFHWYQCQFCHREMWAVFSWQANLIY